MSDNITRLHEVAPPRVPDTIREQLIKDVEELLQEARAGEISEMIVLVQHSNPEQWSERKSAANTPISTWIGRLEIFKYDLITRLHQAEEIE